MKLVKGSRDSTETGRPESLGSRKNALEEEQLS